MEGTTTTYTVPDYVLLVIVAGLTGFLFQGFIAWAISYLTRTPAKKEEAPESSSKYNDTAKYFSEPEFSSSLKYISYHDVDGLNSGVFTFKNFVLDYSAKDPKAVERMIDECVKEIGFRMKLQLGLVEEEEE